MNKGFICDLETYTTLIHGLLREGKLLLALEPDGTKQAKQLNPSDKNARTIVIYKNSVRGSRKVKHKTNPPPYVSLPPPSSPSKNKKVNKDKPRIKRRNLEKYDMMKTI